MLGVIGLILAIAAMIIFAYKGLGALPLAILGALIAILFNRMNIWEAFSGSFAPGYAGAFTSYLLLFVASALYAKFMDTSGLATSIGYKMVDWFGTRHVVLVGILIVAVLTYSGVSLFVVIFAVAPILFMMFQEADLPRHLTAICFSAGSSTFTMTCLPGTPQLSNVVATEYLGTTLNAAPVMGIICGVALFLMCWGYAEWATKRARERGEGWTPIDSTMAVKSREEVPSSWKGFVTVIVLLATIIIGSALGVNSTLIAVAAMLLGCLLVAILAFDQMKNTNWIKFFSDGAQSGVSSIGGIAAILGFGAVIRATPAYQTVVDWCLGLDISPLLLAVVVTCVICAITGGSSSGQRIMYETMAPVFIASGANLEVLHRLIAIASGSLDTLPHSSGLFVVYQVLGLNHKNAYRHTFATSVVAPFIVTVAATLICLAMGM